MSMNSAPKRHREFDRALQIRLARLAVGPSTVRGPGNKNALRKSRKFLRELDIRLFAARSQREFQRALDRETNRLRRRYVNHNWGLARKVLNIFLRDCLYSRHICQRYRLLRVAKYFELPLDSKTGGELCKQDGGLAKWATIKGLTPKRHRQYQEAAKRVSRREGLLRVDLDALWWTG
jgi:hypothetical protein